MEGYFWNRCHLEGQVIQTKIRSMPVDV
jgi:hypothetical protein